MLKISTKSIDTNKTSPSENGLNRDEEKNKGGFLGGLKYLGQSVLAGVGSVLEGIVDVTVALGADLTGNHDFAESMFENNVVGDWHADNTEEFNPGGGWQFFGDVGQGLGQSAFLLVPYAGLPIFITGVSSQGISDAAEQTGDVGIKETAYGITMGAVEGGLEATFSGMGKAGTKIAANMASRSGKSAVKGVTKSAVRKSAGKKILSDAASEFLEESVSEVIDVGLQRAYQIDPDKQLSIRDVLYSGAVGAVSGGISSGVSEGISLSSNLHRGNKIVKNGNEQTLVNTATSLADRLAASGTKFEKGPEWVKRLRGEVDAYDKLSDSEKQGTKGKVLLGEMQSSLYFAETQAIVSVTSNSIMNADLQTRATIAEYINQTYDKSQRKRDFTAEDIKNNTENIATGLAILKFASYVMDPDAAIADLQQEQGIANVIARESGAVERTGVQTPEAVPAGAVQFELKKDSSGNTYVDVDETIVNETDSPKQIAQTLSDIVRTKFTDYIDVKGQKIGIKQKTAREWVRSKSAETLRKKDNQKYLDKANAFGNADEILQATKDYIGEATKHTRKDSFVEFARGVVDFKVGDNGYSADVIVGTTNDGKAILYDVVNIQSKKIVANESDTVQDRRHDTFATMVTDTSYAGQFRRSDASVTDNSISQSEGKVKSKTEENVSKGKTDEKGENLRSEAVESWSSRGEGETQKNTRRDLKRGAESGTIDATASRKENSDGKVGNDISGRRNDQTNDGKQSSESEKEHRRDERIVEEGRLDGGRNREKLVDEDSAGRKLTTDIARHLSGTAIVDLQGRPIRVVHATEESFDTFEKGDIGFHFGSDAQAQERAKRKNIAEPVFIRAYLNIKNPVKCKRDTMSWQPMQSALNLWDMGIITLEERNTVYALARESGGGYSSPAAIKLREILESKGYDGIAYPNGFEGGGTSYIAFRDEQIIRADGNSEGIDGATGKSPSSVANATASPRGEGLVETEGKGEAVDNANFYKKYRAQMRKWDKKTIGFSFVLGNTSSALLKAKIPRAQIRLDASKVKKAIEKHDGMSIEVFEKLTNIIENPIVVVDSKTVKGRKVIIGDVVDENGKTVVLALELSPTSRSGNVLTGIIKVATAQGRSHIQSLLSGNILYVDQNEKRVQQWLNANRLQLPLRSSTVNPNNSITQNEPIVNSSDEKYDLSSDTPGANPSSVANATASPEGEASGEVDLERAKRDAERMIEWEKKNAPTASELNTAREYVKRFDNLPSERQLAIVRMMRSAEGVDADAARGVANIMAITNSRGQVLAPDLEFRFAEFGAKSEKRGIKTEIGGKTVIVLNVNAKYKDTIRGSIAHEIVHYLENRTGYKALAEFAMKHAKADKVAEVRETYTNYYRRKFIAELMNNEKTDEALYNLDESFGQQLQDWREGNGQANGKYNGKFFKLGTTPDILIKHGAPSGEVIMYEDCLLKITGLKHSISLDELSKIPSQLNDPILLFKGSVENSFVALTEIKDKIGNDVIVAVHINKKMGRSVINKITSVYSKTDDYGNNKISNYVTDQIKKGNLLDASVKKAPNWFTTSGLQLPHVVQTILDANNSIHQKNDLVNTSEQKNNLTDFDNIPDEVRAEVERRLASAEFKAKVNGEITASVVGEMLNSEKLLKRYVQKDDSTIKKIGRLIKGIVTSLKGKDSKAEAVAAQMAFLFDKALGSEVAGEKTGEKYSVIQKDGVYYTPTDEEIIKNHPTINGVIINDAEYSEGHTLPDDEYKAYQKKQVQKANKMSGTYTNKDTAYSDQYGLINAEFGNKAIKKGRFYGGIALYDILPYVPQIFENAVVLNTKPDSKSDTNIKGIVNLVGCAILNNKYVAVVKLNVKEYANDEAKIYDNRVIEIEELTVVERVGHQEAKTSSDSTSSAVSSKYIIAKFREFVKNNDEKKSLTNSDIKNSTEQYDLDPEAVAKSAKEQRLIKENEKLKQAVKKERSLREKMAREEANAAKAEAARRYNKKEVEPAIRHIEALDDEEVKSLGRGYELEKMSIERRERLISDIYIALHEASAKGEAGPGSVAVKILATRMAWDVIDSWRIKGQDGKRYHVNDVYDEASVQMLVEERAELLYKQFANMGKHTKNSFFLAEKRAMDEKFKRERLMDEKVHKLSREVAYQGKRLRKLVERQKRDMEDAGIIKVTKTLASVVDTKGNIRIGAVDDAIAEADSFYSMESAKLDSETKEQLLEGVNLTDFALEENNALKFMLDEFKRLRSRVDERTGKERRGGFLDADEMRMLGGLLMGLRVTLERYNKAYINGHWIDIDKAANDVVTDVSEFASIEKKAKTKVGELFNSLMRGIKQSYFYNVLSPETVIESLEGFKTGGVLKTLYHDIRVHKQRSEHMAVRMKKPFAEFLDAKREIEVEVSGEDFNDRIEKSSKKGKKITPDMSDDERYEVLKDKKIQPVKIEIAENTDVDFDYLEKNIKSKIEKPLIKRLRELGCLKKYSTEEIDVDFEFTGGGLRKSLNAQATSYGGSFADLAKAILNIQDLLDSSVLLEIHSDKGKGTDRENKQLVQTFVLMSSFSENNSIVPVQFEVKQFVDNANRLYLAVALTKIETGVVGNTTLDKNQASTYLLPVSDISIADLFAKINIKDENFFKYIPDGFLNGEQIEAKRRALDKDAEKYGTKKAEVSTERTSEKEVAYSARSADGIVKQEVTPKGVARQYSPPSDNRIPQSDDSVNKKNSTIKVDPMWKDEKGHKVSGANSVTDSDFDERSRIQKNVSIFNSAEENADVLNMISSVEAKTHNDNDKVYFENVSDNIAKIIHQLTGVDVKGFKVAIEARQLEHILNRHGKNGKQDQSLSDNSDIAKIESVLKNPDKIRRAGKTKAYSYTQDNKNKTADTVLYEMLLKDKSYYVVQAVPDTKSKTLYIVTAFMGEQGYESKITKGTPQLIDANAPTRTSENDFVVVPKNIIHQSKQNVNKKISTIKVDPTWKEGKGHKHSYRDKLVKKTISVCGHEITLGEAVYLYMLTKRKHAHAGLKKGGFIIYDEHNQQKLKFRIEDVEAARAEIFGKLDDADKVFLNMAEDFFNITASEIKRNADMEIFGYTNNEDGYYVPIIRDRYSRMMGVTDARQSISSIITVYNPSFTQKTVHNAKALEGKSIMDIICDHADALADYSELYLPLKSFDRIYNRGVAIDGEVTSLREVLQNRVWSGTDRYLRDLFADIQGQNRKSDNVIDSMVGKLRSAWVNSVLGLNLKVVVTQTTSFVAANQVIEARYLMPAMKKFFGNQSELGARADEYSDIIEARSFEMGALRAQGNIDKVMEWSSKTGFMINLMDRRVCLAVFHAAELKAEAQGKGKVGTVENARAAARIADEAIFTTQAMTSAAERSALQRSKSEIARALSMFTSDSVKNLSHFVGNIMKYQAHKARAKSDLASKAQYEAELNKDAKAIRRSAKTLVATGVMLGLITQAFKYLYAKEEEEPEDKVKDLATDIVASTFNILPGVSDAIDKFVFDYDMSLNVFDVANDTIEDTASLMNMAARAMRGEYVSGENVFKNVFNFVKTVGAAFGAPVAPVERTVTGLLRRFAPSAVYGYDAMMYNPSYTADLKKAVEDGDERLAEHILETLYKNEATGVYSSTELEEVADLYQKGYTGVLPQRIGAEINGVTLNRKQRKQFESIYSEASDKVNAFIRSEYYDDLTDAQKAKAIKNIYALYYNRAAAEVVGEEWSNAQAYSRLTDNYSALFAAQAYKSGLFAYKDASGKEVTVKEQFVQYVKNLGLSREDELVVLYANGYRDKETKAAMIEYINSLSISAEEKAQIAKRLGFALENGKVVEKKEEPEIRA